MKSSLELLEFILFMFFQSQLFSTMKGELLPYIVKKQMSQPVTHTEADKPMSDFNVNPHVDDIFAVNPNLDLVL